MKRWCVERSLTSGILAFQCDRPQHRASLCEVHFRYEVGDVAAAQGLTWAAAARVVDLTPREVDPRALKPKPAVA